MIIPSIDLLGGRVARLVRGDPERSIIYSDDPRGFAEEFLERGARLIHVVDLDSAIGSGSNRDLIMDLISSGFPIQVGGGIRNAEYAEELLERGARRIIIGTLAHESLDVVRHLISRYGAERIAVAVDYRRGRIAISGWLRELDLTPLDYAGILEKMGVAWVLATCIDRDGTLSGADLDLYSELKRRTGLRIMASGGVSSMQDILALKKIGVDAVIIGRALYEGLIRLEEALEAWENAL